MKGKTKMKKKTVEYLQQGDVLLIPATIPKEAKRLETNVLQHGEATGHAHRAQFLHEGKRASGGVFEVPGSLEKYLSLDKPTELTHEEHKAITIPAGEYAIRIVREYDHFAEEARNVVD